MMTNPFTRMKPLFPSLVLLLLGGWLFFPTHVLAQTAKIDSLKRVLEMPDLEDTVQIRIFSDLAHSLLERNPIST